MKKKVLIFPCGSEIGLEILRSLKFSTHFEVFGASSVDDHGKFVYQNYIGNLPFVDESNFTARLNAVIKERQIDFIFPAHDSVLLKLAQEKDAGNLQCELITSPLSTCEIARSKRKTYEALRDTVPTPKVYDNKSVSESDLPIFLKPDVGQGSKGVRLAKSLEDVEFYCRDDPDLLLLEYLPGDEYTVDCFTDKDGQLLFSQGRVRNRILNGISVNTSTVEDKRFSDMAGKINHKLEIRGPWFFQIKESKGGELVLMEIAPRIAGTMALVRAKGVNLPLLGLFDALGNDVSVFENGYEIVIDRALENLYKHNIDYKHVYLDFDDLVIYEDKVNLQVIAFIYQCINKDIKLHLLTKHREILEDTLKKYRLSGVFDELLSVKNHEEKHTFIKEKDAIFIDDSFAERQSVYDVLGIPVFDSHAIEALMERF